MPFCGSIGFIRFFIDMLLAVLMPMLMAQPCVLLRMVSFANPTHLLAMVVMSRTMSSIDVKLLLAIDAMVRPFQLRLAMMRSVLEILCVVAIFFLAFSLLYCKVTNAMC